VWLRPCIVNALTEQSLKMAAAPTITDVQVEFLHFPAVVTSPATAKTYFLGGAGSATSAIKYIEICVFELTYIFKR